MAKLTQSNLLDTLTGISIRKSFVTSRTKEEKAAKTGVKAVVEFNLDGVSVADLIEGYIYKHKITSMQPKIRAYTDEVWTRLKREGLHLKVKASDFGNRVAATAPLPSRASIEAALGLPLTEEQYASMQEKGICA